MIDISQAFTGFLANLTGPINTLFLSLFLEGLSQILILSFVISMGPVMLIAITYSSAELWFLSLVLPTVAQRFGFKGSAKLGGFIMLTNLPIPLFEPLLTGTMT